MKNFWPVLVLAVFSSSIISAGLASFMVLQFASNDEPDVEVTSAVQKTDVGLKSEEVSIPDKEESIITGNSVQLEPKCLESCDDGNPCTSDVCDETTGFHCKQAALRGEVEGCKGIVEGTCSRNSCVSGFCTLVYTASCCGNDKCDNGESSSVCPKDCQQTQSTAQIQSDDELQSKSLSAIISFSSNPIKRGSDQTVNIKVKDGGIAINGASVSSTVTYASGTTKDFSGLTNSNGEYIYTWKIGGNSKTGTFAVTATATKEGYQSGSASASFEVISAS